MLRRPPLTLTLALLYLTGTSAVEAQDGTLDPSFWTDGQMALGQGTPGQFSVSEVLAAPDGALVVVARRALASGLESWTWMRVTDSTLGGLCVFTPPGSTDVMHQGPAAFDSQGRLVLGGSLYLGTSDVIGGAARFLYPACTLDASFGASGYQALDLTNGFEVLDTLVIDPLDRIYLAGMYLTTGIGDTLVLALEENGAPRLGFSDDGWVRFDALAAQRTELPVALLLQPDGKLVLAGILQAIIPELPDEMYAARLLPDGEPDPEFGAPGDGGAVVVGFAPDDSAALAMALDPVTGRLALGGQASSEPGQGIAAMALLHPDGSLDPTFAGVGKMSFEFGEMTSSAIIGLAFDGLGRILTAGSARVGASGSNFEYVGARFYANGALDGGFGDEGIAAIPFDLGNPPADRATAFTLQGGRPVLAGDLFLIDNTYKPGIARLQAALIFADGFELGADWAWSSSLALLQ